MEISHRRHATRQFIECGIAVIHSSECVDAFGKRFGLGREKHLDGMGCHVERKTVDGRRFVFEQHAELRHTPFGPQGYRRNACRMEIAAFGHREIGHGNKNFAAQLPVTVVHPVRRDRVGKQRRRAQRAVGLIGDDFPRNQIVVPVGRPPVDYGYNPVIARPQFEIERARRKIPGDLQFGPWPRLCVEQDGLRRVHDPAGVRLFQDQQPGRVPEPLRVGGGARHGFERDVRADGFQPERDFDAGFFLRGRMPERFPFRAAARQEGRHYE